MENQKVFVPCLRGKNGPLHGADFWIEKDEFIIGRHPESDLVINNNTISAKHAKIVKEGDNYILFDLNSTNGTKINQEKISQKRLRTDDIIAFDKLEFQFIYKKDVSRTIISEQDHNHSPDSTEIHAPQTQKASFRKNKSPDTGAIQKRIVGIFSALVVSLFFIGGAIFLSNYLASPIKTLGIIMQVLGISFTELPLLLLPTYWIQIIIWDISIIKFFSIPVTCIISGIILQRTNPKSRYKNAIYFTYLFIGVTLLIQFSIQGFNFQKLYNIYASFGYGLSGSSINLILHFFFMITVIFIPTYMGTFFKRKITIENILMQKL